MIYLLLKAENRLNSYNFKTKKQMTSISDKMSTTWTFLSEMPANDTLSFILLVVAAACLNEWAFVHYIAGILVVPNGWVNNNGKAMNNFGLTTGIDYEAYEYPVHTNRIFIQHGLNLAIAGLFSDLAIGGLVLNWEAAPMIALVAFLVDVAYFIAFDLPHLGPIPAEAQTYIISLGLICSAVFTYLNSSKGSWDLLEMIPYVVSGIALPTAALLNRAFKLAGGWGSPIIMDGSMDYADAIMLA